MSTDSAPSTIQQLEQQIGQQKVLFNHLRSRYAAGSPELEEAKNKLAELQKSLGRSKAKEAGPKDAN